MACHSFLSMTALVPDPMKPSVAKHVLQTLHATQTKYVPDPNNPDPSAVRLQEVKLWEEPDVIQAIGTHHNTLCHARHSWERIQTDSPGCGRAQIIWDAASKCAQAVQERITRGKAQKPACWLDTPWRAALFCALRAPKH